MDARHRGFTLIELLITISIIAVVSTVTVIALNPAELLRRARDAQRLSDLSTIKSAMTIYIADTGGSIGAASTTYVSIADPSATSTNACSGLALLSPAATTAWQCSSASNYRKTDGTGWIPVNFSLISAGSPIGQLPVDPLQATSSNLYYTFTASGNDWQIIALPESAKYKTDASANTLTLFPHIFTAGTTSSLSYLYNSNLIDGYWPFDEGVGSSSADVSGNGFGVTLYSSFVWQTCQIANCVAYNALLTWAQGPSISNNSAFTLSAWIDPTGFPGTAIIAGEPGTGTTYFQLQLGGTGNAQLQLQTKTGGTIKTATQVGSLSQNTWTFVTGTFDGTALRVYVNGLFSASTTGGFGGPLNQTFAIGGNGTSLWFKGAIDDVRMYSRALSDSEVLALYNSQK